MFEIHVVCHSKHQSDNFCQRSFNHVHQSQCHSAESQGGPAGNGETMFDGWFERVDVYGPEPEGPDAYVRVNESSCVWSVDDDTCWRFDVQLSTRLGFAGGMGNEQLRLFDALFRGDATNGTRDCALWTQPYTVS